MKMNKSNLIWGIICLVIAGVLAVLNLTLPPESLMFQIGDINMPWVPPVVLGIVGVILLATARSSEENEAKAKPTAAAQDPEKAALNKRLESISWGCFLIMLGGFALIPGEVIPKGLWSISVGVIMLSLNAARYVSKIKMSGFTTVLGVLALLGGIAELLGVTSMEGALLLFILGAYLILKPWFDKRRLFGKAEEG
jgi:uncharacterized membrane protein YvlD (DUF360 family)